MAEIWLLVIFHLVFFRAFYFQNPYVYAQGEELEHDFSCFIHLGRELREDFWQLQIDDPYYYPDFSAIPYQASFYPPHRVAAWVSSFCGLDQAWIIFVSLMVLHYLASSCCLYWLIPGPTTLKLCGAITLSSLAYAMKQNNCIAYTVCWLPVLVWAACQHWLWLFGISLGAALLAGYWPLALTAIPLACCCWLFS